MKKTYILKKAMAAIASAALALSAFSFSAMPALKAKTQQELLEEQLEENKARQEELESKISSARNDISRQKEYQESIDEQIAATEEYIRTLTQLIADYDLQIEELDGSILEKEADIEATQAQIDEEELEIAHNISIYEKQLRAMYISGNDSVASVILGANSFFDMLMKLEMVKRVADANNDFIDQLVAILESYEYNKSVLEQKKAALESDKKTVEQKQSEVVLLKEDWDSQLLDLNQLYSESETELRKLRDLKESYEENRDELEEEAEKIEEEIQRIIREASRAEYMGDLPKGTFLWPLPGYYQITSAYGSRWGTTHRGIDISGSGVMGAEITAANSGVVITVYNGCTHNYGKKRSCGCGGGFGNYCIIDHGGSYATLYGHATEITVSEGDYVTTGDVIGYVGSTGYSTGAHLHFEVRVDGERKDPESFNLIRK